MNKTCKRPGCNKPTNRGADYCPDPVCKNYQSRLAYHKRKAEGRIKLAEKLPKRQCMECREWYQPKRKKQKTCGKPACVRANRNKMCALHHKRTYIHHPRQAGTPKEQIVGVLSQRKVRDKMVRRAKKVVR